jgi:anti-anti-sigma factor
MFTLQESHQLADTMFTLSRTPEAAVVSLSCPSIQDSQARILAHYLRQLAGESAGRIVLEVAGVGKFTCAWINALIEVSRHCESLGGRMFILGMPRRERKLISSTGLDRYLHLSSGRGEAIAFFQSLPSHVWRFGPDKLLDLSENRVA